jgi:hypothetical protein
MALHIIDGNAMLLSGGLLGEQNPKPICNFPWYSRPRGERISLILEADDDFVNENQ